MSENPNEQYVDAVEQRKLNDFLRRANEKVRVFYDRLLECENSDLKFKKELIVDRVPDELDVATPLGNMTLRVVYGFDNGRIRAWIVISDQDPHQHPHKTRQLLAVKLDSNSWVGPYTDEYHGWNGLFSAEKVLMEALAVKLKLDTEFLNSIK